MSEDFLLGFGVASAGWGIVIFNHWLSTKWEKR